MNSNAKYLRITIHDNDFRLTLQEIGQLLYETFQMEDRYPTENDFPGLKKVIQHLWLGADMAHDLMRWGRIDSPDIEYFNPRLEFVDYFDIPDWDNAESIYIPMFDDSYVLFR